jgi:hypothetical protein
MENTTGRDDFSTPVCRVLKFTVRTYTSLYLFTITGHTMGINKKEIGGSLPCMK